MAASNRQKPTAVSTNGTPPIRGESSLIEPEDPPGGIENYPLDELLIRSEARSIQDVLRRIDKNQIILDPDFQRDFVWSEGRQSRLIESVLMRIPLQVFYFAEDSDGNLIVVDGLQRLTTLRRFYKGDLSLDLKARSELDGKHFVGLSAKLQTRFEDGQLTFYIIGAKVPERVRLDIFERVNAGMALTRQQMRNALYNGPATRLLYTLASLEEFKDATGGVLSRPEAVAAMRDREAVNRFLAHFHLGWRTYGVVEDSGGAAATDPPDFDDFLGRALRALNGTGKDGKNAEAARTRAETAFRTSMKLNQQVFGKHAFRKSMAGSGDKRSSFSLALFDVFSVGLARYTLKSVTPAKIGALRSAIRGMFKKEAFVNAISYATAQPRNVRIRFELTEANLQKVLGDPDA